MCRWIEGAGGRLCWEPGLLGFNDKGLLERKSELLFRVTFKGKQ